MKLRTLIVTLAITLTSTAHAAGGHDHSPKHGGVVAEGKDWDFELVAKPAAIQLYVRNSGKPADVSKATAKVTMLSGSDKQEVELKAAGDRLEAVGTFKVAAGTKAVAIVTINGKPATVRFTVK
jgi:hypothetical protein